MKLGIETKNEDVTLYSHEKMIVQLAKSHKNLISDENLFYFVVYSY
jgi:hypothetical protein